MLKEVYRDLSDEPSNVLYVAQVVFWLTRTGQGWRRILSTDMHMQGWKHQGVQVSDHLPTVKVASKAFGISKGTVNTILKLHKTCAKFVLKILSVWRPLHAFMAEKEQWNWYTNHPTSLVWLLAPSSSSLAWGVPGLTPHRWRRNRHSTWRDCSRTERESYRSGRNTCLTPKGLAGAASSVMLGPHFLR